MVAVRISTPPGSERGTHIQLRLPFDPLQTITQLKRSGIKEDQIPWRISADGSRPKLACRVAKGHCGEQCDIKLCILQCPRDAPRGQQIKCYCDGYGIIGLRPKIDTKKGQWIVCNLSQVGKMKPPPHPMAVAIAPSPHPSIKGPFTIFKGTVCRQHSIESEEASVSNPEAYNSGNSHPPPLGIGYRVVPVPLSDTTVTPRFRYLSKFFCGLKFGYEISVKIPKEVEDAEDVGSRTTQPQVLLLDNKLRVNAKRVMVICPPLCTSDEQYVRVIVGATNDLTCLDYSKQRSKYSQIENLGSSSLSLPSMDTVSTAVSTVAGPSRAVCGRMTALLSTKDVDNDDELSISSTEDIVAATEDTPSSLSSVWPVGSFFGRDIT